MTERVAIQKDFPPVECLSSPGSSGVRPEREGFWTAASGGCQLDWRDRANDVSRSKRRPSRHHIRMEGQECLIFCRAFRCGP
jgi:hypothetical protein